MQMATDLDFPATSSALSSPPFISLFFLCPCSAFLFYSYLYTSFLYFSEYEKTSEVRSIDIDRVGWGNRHQQTEGKEGRKDKEDHFTPWMCDQHSTTSFTSFSFPVLHAGGEMLTSTF